MWVFRQFVCNKNKTADYHRLILRLPFLLKRLLKRWKGFFSKHCFFIFLNISYFKNSLIFRQKHLIFRAEKTFSRNHTISNAFCSKFATFSDFEKNSGFFFEKPIYFSKKLQILNVSRILAIPVAFCSKFATFSDVEKIKSFFLENLINFFRKTNFRRYEKFYYFSRILRQICYNLVKKKFTFRSVNEHRERNWQTSGKKTSEMYHLRERFCFHILKNMAKINKAGNIGK